MRTLTMTTAKQRIVAICMMCCILLSIQVDCYRRAPSYRNYGHQLGSPELLRRIADHLSSLDSDDDAPGRIESSVDDDVGFNRLADYNNNWRNSIKRDCRFNLGGHCETENAAAVAAHWNYLDSPWSPGRRRKRVDQNAQQQRQTQRFNVLYRQLGIVTSPPDTTDLILPSRPQRTLARRRCLRYVVTSPNGDLVPKVTCSAVQSYRKQ